MKQETKPLAEVQEFLSRGLGSFCAEGYVINRRFDRQVACSNHHRCQLNRTPTLPPFPLKIMGLKNHEQQPAYPTCQAGRPQNCMPLPYPIHCPRASIKPRLLFWSSQNRPESKKNKQPHLCQPNPTKTPQNAGKPPKSKPQEPAEQLYLTNTAINSIMNSVNTDFRISVHPPHPTRNQKEFFASQPFKNFVLTYWFTDFRNY